MKKIAAGFAGIVLAVSMTACSGESETPAAPTVTVTAEASDSPSEPTPSESDTNDFEFSDEQFADLIRENTDAFDGATDEQIVEVAEGFCDMWEAGADFNDVVEVVAESGVDPVDSGFLVGAGTAAFCPEYEDRLPTSDSNA